MADSKFSALPTSTTPLVGTELLPIVQSGVTKKINVEDLNTFAPAFSAYASAAQTIPDGGTSTKITLDVENFDTNSNFASSRFTPTVAGYYQISAAVFYNSTFGANIVIASIWKNGATEKSVVAPFLANGYGAAAVSTLIYMNGSTDYIELYTFQNSGAPQTTQGGNESTWMTGVLIRT